MKLPQGIKITKTERTNDGLVMTVEIAWWYMLYIKTKNIPCALWHTLKQTKRVINGGYENME